VKDDGSGPAEPRASSHLRDLSTSPPVTWSRLGASAKAFRLAHAAWGIAGMGSLGYIWYSASVRRRGRLLGLCMAFLSIEGIALLIGRGDCPFGPLQARLGDPVPLFELVLPARAAKAAIPILTVASVVGMVAAVARSGQWPPPKTSA
jgi:hypothetical protein